MMRCCQHTCRRIQNNTQKDALIVQGKLRESCSGQKLDLASIGLQLIFSDFQLETTMFLQCDHLSQGE